MAQSPGGSRVADARELLEGGQYDRAIEHLQSLLDGGELALGDSIEALVLTALGYHVLGRPVAARAALIDALRADSGFEASNLELVSPALAAVLAQERGGRVTAGDTLFVELGTSLLQWAREAREPAVIAIRPLPRSPLVEMITRPPLTYPETMRREGLGGSVLLQAVLDTAGRVESGSVHVRWSSGRAFEASARDFVSGARFRPVTVEGRAARVLFLMPVTFGIGRADSDGQPDTIVVVRPVIERPEVVSRPGGCPYSAFEHGLEGTVILEAIIDSRGRVEPNTIRVVTSAHPVLDAAARRSLRRARFRPALVRRYPVRALVRIPFEYKCRRPRVVPFFPQAPPG